MPKLGLTMTKGTIVRWFKNEGERVEKGEKLALFETEKVTTEITAPASGILLKRHFEALVKGGVQVGNVLRDDLVSQRSPIQDLLQHINSGTCSVHNECIDIPGLEIQAASTFPEVT